MKILMFLVSFITLYSCKDPKDTNNVIDKRSILLREKNNNIIDENLVFCYNYDAPDPKYKKKYADWIVKWQNGGGRIASIYVINDNNYDIIIYSECNSCFNVRKWFKNGKPDESGIWSGRGVEYLTKSFVKSKDSIIMYLNYQQSDSLNFNFEWQKVGLDSVYRQEAKMFTYNGILKAYPTKCIRKRLLNDMHQSHHLDKNKYVK